MLDYVSSTDCSADLICFFGKVVSRTVRDRYAVRPSDWHRRPLHVDDDTHYSPSQHVANFHRRGNKNGGRRRNLYRAPSFSFGAVLSGDPLA